MRAEAGADVRQLLRLRIVHGQVASRALDREQLRRGMTRSRLAVVRILRRAHRRRDPDTALFIEHRIVDVVLARPDHLLVPVRRRSEHLRRGRWCVRIADGELHLVDRVLRRIEDGQVIGAQLESAVDGPVRVHGGVAPIRRHFVVQVRLRVGPVPQRDDHVALHSLRPRRRRRQLAARHAIRPVAEQQQRALAAQLLEAAHHVAARLARLDAPLPCVRHVRKLADRRGDVARRLVAELMAGRAAARLEAAQPLRLGLDGGRDAVAGRPRARELALLGNLEQREPVAGRIVVGRRVRARRGHGLEVQRLAGRRLHLRRVHQAVAAHPHAVAGLRKIGDQVAAQIVRDDDPRELRRQIGGLGNHPDASLRALVAADDPAQVVGVDGHGRCRWLSCIKRKRSKDAQSTCGDNRSRSLHASPLSEMTRRHEGSHEGHEEFVFVSS